jgi:hypothetical protein
MRLNERSIADLASPVFIPTPIWGKIDKICHILLKNPTSEIAFLPGEACSLRASGDD